MKIVVKKLKRVRQLQNVVLAYLALLVVVMFVTWALPDKQLMLKIFIPIFFGMAVVIPFALGVMVFSIRVFHSMAKIDPTLETRVKFAGWLSVFTGIYFFSYVIFLEPIGLWAFTQSHDLVVAFQSSPVVVGLILLATHVFVARASYSKLNSSVSSPWEHVDG